MNTTQPNPIERVTTKIILAALIVQILVWVFYISAFSINPGQSMVTSDSCTYYWHACEFFRTPSLQVLQNSQRQLFTAPLVLPLLLTNQPINYNTIHLLNHGFWGGLMLLSFWRAGRRLGASYAARAAALALLFTSPYFFAFSTVLHADVSLAAACIIYFTAMVWALFDEKKSLWSAIGWGCAFGLGLITKPVFLFAVAIISVAGLFIYLSQLFLLDRGARGQKVKFLIRQGLIALFVGSLWGYLLYNRELMAWIKEQYYVNETLGYWIFNKGVWNTWLWAPMTLLQEFPLLPLSILVIMGIISGALLLVNKSKIQCGNIIRKLCEPHGASLAVLCVSCILGFTYFAFWVKSKDFRMAFFLYVLLLLAIFATLDRLARTPLKRWLTLGFLLVTTICTADVMLWNSQSAVSRLISKTITIPGGHWGESRGNTIVITAQDIGITKALECITLNTLGEKTKVIVPGIDYFFNATIANGYQLISRSYSRKNLPERWDDLGVYAQSCAYRYGGFGSKGGISLDFFNYPYVMINRGNYASSVDINPWVYGVLINNRLLENDPHYWDGLTVVAEFKNNFGQKITVAKRVAPPTAENFAYIVKDAISFDKNNLWNVPMIVAANRIAPDAVFIEQLNAMASPDFKTDYVLPDNWQQIIKSLLASPTTATDKSLYYPELLNSLYE